MLTLVTIHPASPAFVAQTAAEYGGLLNAIIGGIVAARSKVESIVGEGNLKYYLIGALVLCVLYLLRRRR